jgi:hypothetical protein
MLGRGVFQLPKNNTAPNILTKSIIPYSANMITAHRKPEYSVWNPATSSDSASGKSNGALLHSASEAIKKIIHAPAKKRHSKNIPGQESADRAGLYSQGFYPNRY